MTDLLHGALGTEFLGAALGWLGTAGTFTAYVLIWRGWVPTTAKRYALLNAVGGLLAAGGALTYGAWPAVVSNAVWALIGVHGLVTAGLRGRSVESPAGIDPAAPLTEEEQALFEAITQPLPVITPEMIREWTPQEILPAPVPAVRASRAALPDTHAAAT